MDLCELVGESKLAQRYFQPQRHGYQPKQSCPDNHQIAIVSHFGLVVGSTYFASPVLRRVRVARWRSLSSVTVLRSYNRADEVEKGFKLTDFPFRQ